MKKYRKIYVNVNYDCNYKCNNCIFTNELRGRHNLSTQSFESIKNAFVNLIPAINDGRRNICEITGGEPTIHPEYKEIVKYFSSLKKKKIIYKIVLLTNGHLLSSKTKSIEYLSNIDDVVVAMYTPDEKEHDEITGVRGSFNAKLKAIDNMLHEDVKVHIKSLVLKSSFKKIPKIAKMIGERFGNRIHFTVNTTHFVGDAKKNEKLLAVRLSEASKYVEDAIDIAKEYGMSVGIFYPICLLDPIYWQYSSVDYGSQIKKTFGYSLLNGSFEVADNLIQEFVKRHQICQKCVFQKRCNWPWESYTEIFGSEEIKEGYRKLEFK